MEMAMTLRNLVTLPLLGLGLAALPFAGCGADDKDSDTDGVGSATTGDDDDDDDDNADSGGFGAGPLELAVVVPGFGGYAFDPDEGAIVGAVGTKGDFPPYFGVYLLDEAQSDGCYFAFEADGSHEVSEKAYVTAETLMVAWDIPADAAVESDCADMDLSDPQGLIDTVPNSAWGLGVAPMEDETASKAAGLYGGYWGELSGNALSVGWYWDQLEGSSFASNGYVKHSIGFGFEVDEKFSLVVGEDGYNVMMPAEEVPNPAGGVAKGYYNLDTSLWVISFSG
jgi:hypothetical protein